MREEDRLTALNPKQFRRLGSGQFFDLSTLDESDPDIYETIFYKEVPVVNGNMDETVIVTYSPKYKVYQKRIREQQIARAVKMMEQPGKKRRGRNQNDPARFIKSTAITQEGEVAGKNIYDLNLAFIRNFFWMHRFNQRKPSRKHHRYGLRNLFRLFWLRKH